MVCTIDVYHSGAFVAQDLRYLKRRRNGFYFHMAIPQDLRGRFTSEGRRSTHGRRNPGQALTKVVVSLHTQSLHEAQERRWPHVQQWREKFERARTGAPLTLAEIDAVAHETYAAVLAVMEAEAKKHLVRNVLITNEAYQPPPPVTAYLTEDDKHALQARAGDKGDLEERRPPSVAASIPSLQVSLA